MPHVIRLHSVWQRTLPAFATSVRVQLPDTLHSLRAGERLDYSRSFNRPTGIEGGERVRVVVNHWTGQLSLLLDDTPLATDLDDEAAPLAIEITSALSGSHRLRILINTDKDARIGLDGVVHLEIGD